MSRIRLVATAAMIACGLMLVGGTGIASAQAPAAATPLAKKVPLTGTKGFSGTYTIDRFTSKGNQLYAVGTVTGKLRGKKVTKENVRIPATLVKPAQAAQTPPPVPIPGACQILNLVLGPVNLNLLGLSVRTNEIRLLIEAVPGTGNLLGNLLCAITNALNPGAIPIGQVTALLNAILALIAAITP
jgi:hypothetical protein